MTVAFETEYNLQTQTFLQESRKGCESEESLSFSPKKIQP